MNANKGFVPLEEFGLVPASTRSKAHRSKVHYIHYIRSEVQKKRILPYDLTLLPQIHEAPTVPSHNILPKRDKYSAVLIDVPVNFVQGPVSEGQEPPHGLGRIASSVESLYGQPCGILDAQRIVQNGHILALDIIIQQLQETQPRVVGLNPTCVNVRSARKIADGLTDIGIPYVVGGYFPTLDTKRAMQIFHDAAAIVKGHGEVAFPEIVLLAMEGRLDEVEKIKGVYRPGSAKHRYIHADKLSLYQLPTINQAQYYHNPVETTKGGRKEVSLYETEGCPYDCGFCSSPLLSRRDYKRPRTGRIVDDVENALALGADRIHFLDDLIFITKEHIQEFYSELERRGLLGKFDWRGMGRANLITKWSRDTIRLLKESGCYQLAFGVESGSPRILVMIKKQLTPQQVLEATDILFQYGIASKGFFIFGFPDETLEDMEMTMNLAIEMANRGTTEIAVYEFHPYPGSNLWFHLEKTNPEVLQKLHYIEYLRYDNLEERTADTLAKTSMWLGDDIQIATVPSIKVREYVTNTLKSFYDTVDKISKV